MVLPIYTVGVGVGVEVFATALVVAISSQVRTELSMQWSRGRVRVHCDLFRYGGIMNSGVNWNWVNGFTVLDQAFLSTPV